MLNFPHIGENLMPKLRGTWPLVSTLILKTLFFTEMAVAFPVRVSEAPENLLENTLHTIASARKKLRINIYEMKSAEISEAIIKKIEEGVPVHLLMEGQPVGGMNDTSLEIKELIIAAMQLKTASPYCRFSLMQSPDAVARAADGLEKTRRFNFNHAKYAVVDDVAVLIGSENFSSSNQNSKKKNRGWQIVAKDSEMVSRYAKLFSADADSKAGDIIELVTENPLSKVAALFNFDGRQPWIARSSPDVTGLDGLTEFDANSADHVTSPTTSLSGLKSFISEAQNSLDLELMTFSPLWGSTKEESPLLAEVIAAARRGLKIRVLLNDESVFGGGGNFDDTLDKSSKNIETVELLTELAHEEGLKIEGRIADVKAMGVSYIHNKGAIADGSRVLVSSINWNQNSVEKNREVGVVLHSRDIGRHYETLFTQDWKASEPELALKRH